MQTIGYDKINQLRHANYFKSAQGVKVHMKRHAAILEPKFRAVIDALERELGGKGIAQWNNPNGGYFISLDVLDGCAKRTVELCKNAGVVLTPPEPPSRMGTTRKTAISVSHRLFRRKKS
jgi:DNA-binding transcriptional MocR family regulator